MTSLAVASDKSRARVRTFAEGLFSRLAHDLELVCRDLRGTAILGEDGLGRATLEVPIAAVEVGGTLKGDRVDPQGMARSDHAEILEKMRRDVFHVGAGSTDVVRVEASMLDRTHARLRIVPPCGPAVERTVDVSVEDGAGPRVSGRFTLSLSAIGSDVVRGPMNAFRVKDAVEVLFDVVFRASSAQTISAR